MAINKKYIVKLLCDEASVNIEILHDLLYLIGDTAYLNLRKYGYATVVMNERLEYRTDMVMIEEIIPKKQKVILQLIKPRRDEKIKRIKTLRYLTKWGLKETKYTDDEMSMNSFLLVNLDSDAASVFVEEDVQVLNDLGYFVKIESEFIIPEDLFTI